MKMTKLKTLGLCSIEPMQLQDYWFSERRRETFFPSAFLYTSFLASRLTSKAFKLVQLTELFDIKN